jgi:ferrochelatase
MRCWPPTIDEAVGEIVADGVTELVLLPLYPQYSFTTTRSAFDGFEESLRRRGLGDRIERHAIRDWHDDPAYVSALARTVRTALGEFADPSSVHVIYSAHSIPVRNVEEGDPYLEQTRRTVELVDRELGSPGAWTLAFQSKVGPVKWLEPATQDVIADLGRRGVRRVLVVPVSFVSDHIETLYEIDVYYRAAAVAAGIEEFRRAPALGCADDFIAGLASLVKARLAPLQLAAGGP